MGDRAAKTALFDQFARVGKALSSATRLELVDLLAQGERTVERLAAAAHPAVRGFTASSAPDADRTSETTDLAVSLPHATPSTPLTGVEASR